MLFAFFFPLEMEGEQLKNGLRLKKIKKKKREDPLLQWYIQAYTAGHI